jgi:hypothetical protein
MLGRLFGGGDSRKKKPESWRDGPATPSQKTWAIELGIAFPPDITKGELSDLIEKKEAAKKKQTGIVLSELKKEVEQLNKDVRGLKKTSKKPTKKVVKKKKK